MKQKQKDISILIILIIALIILNYPFIDNKVKDFLNLGEQVHVQRIIDGDTIEAENESIRLLGINTPERGEAFYSEAKNFLEERILNKTVTLEYGKERKDKYGRKLAYVFLENENINLEIVENGYGNPYFPSGKDRHYSEFFQAWKSCIEKEVNICKPSEHQCSQCINIIDSNKLINNCAFSCNISGWKIKAEGRNKTIFQEILKNGEEVSFKLELTPIGDTLFLWDNETRLVLWEIYSQTL